MTTNALAPYEQFDTMQRAAMALYKSGYFTDATSEAQAIVKVMAGAELGVPPFASMTGIHIIKGKPTLSANLIATLVKSDPRYDYRVKRSDDEACVLTWYENGEVVGEAGFTINDAKRANLLGNNTWKMYPSDMLFARAISRGAKRYAPGIFGGAPVYTPDEMGVDVDMDGNIIDVTPEIVDVSEPVVVAQGNGKLKRVPVNEDGEYVSQYTDADAEVLDVTPASFPGKVAELVDYYKHANHVKNTMKQLGAESWSDVETREQRVEWLHILQKHAEDRAAEKAVEQVNGDLFGETAKAPMDAYSE